MRFGFMHSQQMRQYQRVTRWKGRTFVYWVDTEWVYWLGQHRP